MDRLFIADGAKPFEWIGAEVEAVDAAAFPVVMERLRRVANALHAPAIDVTLGNQWCKVRDLLAQARARPQFIDFEMAHADCAWGADRPLPADWHWVPATAEREQAY